jgi:hypothetical protein
MIRSGIGVRPIFVNLNSVTAIVPGIDTTGANTEVDIHTGTFKFTVVVPSTLTVAVVNWWIDCCDGKQETQAKYIDFTTDSQQQ